MDKPKKLVVLGGGMGTLSALFQITSQPDWQKRYDITVYQIGFRLGGKGASGRNTGYYNRIEEHGYHVLFGFYHNTLAMMKACYQELGRSPDAPISDFYADSPEDERTYPDRYAIKRANAHTLFQEFPPDWETLRAIEKNLPPDKARTRTKNKKSPAEQHLISMQFLLPQNSQMGDARKSHSFVDVLVTLFDRMLAVYSAAFGHSDPHANDPKTQPLWWSDLEEIAPGLALFMKAEMKSYLGISGHLNAAGFLLKRLPKDHTFVRQDYWDLYQFISRLIRLHITELWAVLKDKVLTDADTYETWIRQDFFGTLFSGIVEDNLMENGLDSINNKNFYKWFEEKAIVREGTELTVRSIMVEVMYNFGFCFRDGDGDSLHNQPIPGQPDIEAGILLRIILRWMFDYEGAPYWFFQVACADALFAPLYEVLLRRGVKFKFFHEITRLHVRDNKVTSIELACQADLKVDQYEPLILVKGIPCWPNQPLYGQIVDGDTLHEGIENGLDIEAPDARWGELKRRCLPPPDPCPDEIVEDCPDEKSAMLLEYPRPLPPLRYQEDFDEVLFGIPPGAFTFDNDKKSVPMCCSLAKASKNWRLMAESLKLIYTEGLEIRLNRSLRELGWSEPYRLLGMVGVSDLNTFNDLPAQLRWESWPQADPVDAPQKLPPQYNPKALLYFVSGMPTSAPDYKQHILEASLKFLNGYFIDILPDAAAYTGRFHLDPIDPAPQYVPVPQDDLGQISGFIWTPDTFVFWTNDAAETTSKITVQWRLDPNPVAQPYSIQRPDLGATLGAQWSRQNESPTIAPKLERWLLTWSNIGKAFVWDTINPPKAGVEAEPYRSMSHNGPVLGGAWSPDQQFILTWSEDSTACVWKMSSVPIQQGPGTIRHNGPVLGAAWSPDGRHILTCCKDGAARIWEISGLDSYPFKPTFKMVCKLQHSRAVLGGSWTAWEYQPDRIVTWSDDHTARVWELNQNICEKVTVLRHSGPVLGAQWLQGPNFRLLTWSTDKTARIWDLSGVPLPPTGPERQEYYSSELKAVYTMHHSSAVLDASWNPQPGSPVYTPVLTRTEQTVNIWPLFYVAPQVLSETDTTSAAQWSSTGDQVLYAINKREFDWNLLVYDPKRATKPLILTQFLTANTRPSDKYVLTVVNSSKYRLGSADTDFDNLFITGDWTKTTLSVGCMEAATMAGFMASRSMTGYPAYIAGEKDFEFIPSFPPLASNELGKAMLNTLDLSVDFYQDLAKAIVLFLRGMRDEVALGNLTQEFLFNLLTGGGPKGGGQFVNQVQRSITGLQQNIAPFVPRGFDLGKLDYNRLVNLVSAELRNAGSRRGHR